VKKRERETTHTHKKNKKIDLFWRVLFFSGFRENVIFGMYTAGVGTHFHFYFLCCSV